LHSFTGPDGELPKGSLVRDPAGNLYGTTSGGGVYNYGTVFKLDAAGKLTTLYSFSGLSDGAAPEGRLLLENSQLYGATRSGGAAGAGIVFRADPGSGTLAVLHSFAAASSAGDLLYGSVARDSEGSLYRISYAAGETAPSAGTSGPPILEIGAVDYLIALRGLTDPPGGSWTPGDGDLVLDAEGHFYGTAKPDGSGNRSGAILELSMDAQPAATLCVLSPSSQTVIVPWFGPVTDESQVYSVGVTPQNCYLPGATYTASWLSSVTPATGQRYPNGGTGEIVFTASENTSTARRAATIRLGSAFVLTVQQDGYPTISCQYDFSTATIEVPSGGGTLANFSPSVLVPPGADGCIVYAATSKAPWISDLSPSANQAFPGICAPGSTPCVTGATVTPTYTVAANTGAARSAVVRLNKGFAITVNQDAGN
jgi:uncharacterized repeat protein (TIGR03803 family)